MICLVNEDKIKMTPKNNDKVILKDCEEEIYTISQVDTERFTCRADDQDNQGWFISFDHIEEILSDIQT
jgi:hypothetical protein